MKSRAMSRPISIVLHMALVTHVYWMLGYYVTEHPWMCLLVVPALVPLRLVWLGVLAIGITLGYAVAIPFTGGAPAFNSWALGILSGLIPAVMALATFSGHLILPRLQESAPGTWSMRTKVALRKSCKVLVLIACVLFVSRRFPAEALVPFAVALLLSARALRVSSRDPKRTPQRLGDAALSIAGIIFAVCVLEIGTRLFVFISVPEKGLFRPHPKAIVDLQPSVTATVYHRIRPGAVGETRFTISSQSVREEVYGPKEPGEFRILLLGDSFTFGLTLPFPETIGEQLEAMFRESGPPRKITVINLGVPGTGPWQQRIYLEERGFDFEPDLVLHQLFLGNDLHDTLAESNRRLRAFDSSREAVVQRNRLRAAGRFRAEQWLLEHSHAYAALHQWIGPNAMTLFLARDCRLLPPLSISPLPQPKGGQPGWEVNRTEWYPEIEEALESIVSTVSTIRDECSVRGVGYVTYTVPIAEEIATRWYEPARRYFGVPDDIQYAMGKGLRYLDTRWQSLGMPAIPVFGCLRAQPAPETLYHRYDGHTTGAGNAVIARCIYDYLTKVYFPVNSIGAEGSPAGAHSAPDQGPSRTAVP